MKEEEKRIILATKKYAEEDRKKSWFYLLTTLVVLLLGFSGVFLTEHYLFKLFFGIFTGLLLVRFFVIYHDYLHKAILQKSWLSNFIFTVFGLYILAPKSIWKRSHDYHHQQNSKLYTSSIGSFPIVTKNKYMSARKMHRFLYLFVRHPLTILFGYISAFIFGMCVQSLINNPKKHWDSFFSLLFHFGIGWIIYKELGQINFMIGFIMPSFIASAIGVYLFYAQHNFPEAKFEEKEGWTYLNAALKSSSYMKMNRLMHWFTANIGYHHIHHANHRIPFYRLPEVYNNVVEFQNPGLTSLSPKEIYRCLKLKVWDPESNRMIGWKDMK